ncbi:MAG: NAD-dependent epimerase/dehydratase [Candidatus Gottesmanbacteria bacterium GW2011_GWC2_39_8]|uniref:NAD-dependent epimerase/dehydratase n=1 Tax=Candidatus Gottesmanbacteria bacterium GW2011_GWC2_39_8 TaxID=1618450 RepID=A0A0G0Q1R8_9BACT|nr:MAG: NAD-dependent epimerase/dehydratase [Candidatus Gottesmanbacteria bacterium GW2011_GWC2_39_8]
MRNKKVLVTGGAGFIGREVVKQLLKKNYKVRVADNLSKNPEKKDPIYGAEFHKVDLTDKKQTFPVFENIDFCINLAAKIGGIGYFHKFPATILSENNKIYSNTFEAAAKHKIKRMVYVSSSMVFESTFKFPSKESDINHIPPPVTSYGASKLIGEWYCRAFWDEYRLPYSICRPFNAYGINEYPGEEVGMAHVIPDLLKKILEGEFPLKILGNGEQSRCFTHVSDIASGIIAVMESEKGINEDFNIASPREMKIRDLAIILYRLCGNSGIPEMEFESGFTYDIQKRVPDVNKARQLIGWESEVVLEEALKEVVDWFKTKAINK